MVQEMLQRVVLHRVPIREHWVERSNRTKFPNRELVLLIVFHHFVKLVPTVEAPAGQDKAAKVPYLMPTVHQAAGAVLALIQILLQREIAAKIHMELVAVVIKKKLHIGI